ncbi:MAG: hypothetical protein WBK91_05120 [Alphaproteobacteria bacterium]
MMANTEADVTPKLPDIFKRFGTISVPTIIFGYCFVLGIMYEWGYWRVFNVDILEFAALQDIIKLAAYPLLGGIVLLITSLGWMKHTQQQVDKLKNTSFDKFMKRYWGLNLLFFAAVLFVQLHFIPYPFNVQLFSLTFSAYLTSIILSGNFFSNLVPNYRLRSVIVFGVLIAPSVFYVHGANDAQNILIGNGYQYTLDPMQK